MKASLYNHFHLKDHQTAFVWNAMSGAFISVTEEEAEALQRGQIFCLPERRAEFFERKGILIPSGRDERAELENEIKAMSEGASRQEGNFYRILTTTACNASCGYCYERGIPVKTMDAETARQAASFIRWQGAHGIPILEWFGGEPLLYPDIISEICRSLSDFGVPFFSRIVTNGSLWTEGLIQAAAREWQLRSAQITLDGTGPAHENVKGLPAGTFERTIRAIRMLSENGIRVNIRIIHYEGQDQRRIAAWIGETFSDDVNIRAFAVPGYRRGSEYPRDLMLEVLELGQLLGEIGPFAPGKTILPRRLHAACFACHVDNYTIDPEGWLYSCSHNMSKEQRIGDVRNGVTNPKRNQFLRHGLASACRTCSVLPVCMGGCRAGETGIADMTQCPPFKNVIPELMSFRAADDFISAGD